MLSMAQRLYYIRPVSSVQSSSVPSSSASRASSVSQSGLQAASESVSQPGLQTASESVSHLAEDSDDRNTSARACEADPGLGLGVRVRVGVRLDKAEPSIHAVATDNYRALSHSTTDHTTTGHSTTDHSHGSEPESSLAKNDWPSPRSSVVSTAHRVKLVPALVRAKDESLNWGKNAGEMTAEELDFLRTRGCVALTGKQAAGPHNFNGRSDVATHEWGDEGRVGDNYNALGISSDTYMLNVSAAVTRICNTHGVIVETGGGSCSCRSIGSCSCSGNCAVPTIILRAKKAQNPSF